MQEYDRQQEDAALTEEEKQARQQKADADQAAMWESIGNVSGLPDLCIYGLPCIRCYGYYNMDQHGLEAMFTIT